jgi:hypothetical protein
MPASGQSSWTVTACAAALLLAACAPADTDPPRSCASLGEAGGAFRHLVVVGWDGVQRDHFYACYHKQLPGCPDGLPHLAALTNGRPLNLTVTSAGTCTKPGWVEILTGYDAASLGIPDNRVFRAVPSGYSVLEKIQEHLGPDRVASLFIAGKSAHVGGCCDSASPEPWCEVKKRLDLFENGLGENEVVGRRALALLEQHRDRCIAAFFHFRDPDHTGHLRGENSAAYTAKILNDDAWLGEIVAKLKAIGIYQQTLVFVATDHGFDEGGRDHRNAPFGFMGTNDPAVIRGGDRKDVAPTILKRFDISQGEGEGEGEGIPAVHGRPLDEIPTSCVAEGGAFLDYPNAPCCCAGLGIVNLDKVKTDGACIPATGGGADRSGYCTACGDGSCAPPENRCNCPVDCGF